MNVQLEGESTLNSSKFIQCLNHGIHYGENFTEHKFDVNYANTVK